MLGTPLRALFLGLLTLMLVAPVTVAGSAKLEDTLVLLPLEEQETGTALCSGIAPYPQPRCSTLFTAHSSLSISIAIPSTFTGELVCRWVGPLSSQLFYTFEVVGGLAVLVSRSGFVYGGNIHMHCEAYGLFGAANNWGGVGTFTVRVNYA